MREIVIKASCDWCLALDATKRVPATEQFIASLASGNKLGTFRVADCCDDHATQLRLVQAFLDRLPTTEEARIELDGGLKTRKTAKGVEAAVAMAPQQRQAVNADAPPLFNVPRPDDDAIPTSVDEDIAGPCPVCDVVLKTRRGSLKHFMTQHGVALSQPKKCPDCNFRNPRAASMGGHRSKLHNYDPYEVAMEKVNALKAKRQ